MSRIRARTSHTAVAIALLGGCTRPAPPPTSLLLVSLDTVRADRLGCYGRAGAGTPTLDSLADAGTLFEQASAPTPITLPSHASLLTGLGPLRHGVRHNGLFALAPEVETLAERLRSAGVRTGAFVGSVVLDRRYGLAQGFEAYTAPEDKGEMYRVTERPAFEVNRDALSWARSLLPGERFFAWVHYMEAHQPHQPPEPERSRFASDLYQGEVATADRALGELLSGLRELGRLEGTLVVVVADHGEGLGDHGEKTHGVYLYESTIRVPFIVSGPGVQGGRRLPQPVSLLDVAPTALEALGQPLPPDAEGRSLWPALGGDATPPPDRPIYLETMFSYFSYGAGEYHGLRRGPWKLIQGSRPELFELDGDPAEARDLASMEPQRLAAMGETLSSLIAAAAPSAEHVTPSESQAEALAALGYLGGGGQKSPLGGDPAASVIRTSVELDRAGYLAREGKLDEAEAVLRQLLADAPDLAEPRVQLISLLVYRRRNAEAIEEGKRLEEVEARLPGAARATSGAHLVLARLHAWQDDLQAAAREFELALRIPQSAEVVSHAAAVFHDLGRKDEAIAVLQELEDRGAGTDTTRALRLWLEGKGPLPDLSRRR